MCYRKEGRLSYSKSSRLQATLAMMTMLVVHVMSNDAKLLIDSYKDIVSYLFWNSVTVSVLKLNAVRSGNRTAAPITSATFPWNILLLISFVPFHETDFGADAVCVREH